MGARSERSLNQDVLRPTLVLDERCNRRADGDDEARRNRYPNAHLGTDYTRSSRPGRSHRLRMLAFLSLPRAAAVGPTVVIDRGQYNKALLRRYINDGIARQGAVLPDPEEHV